MIYDKLKQNFDSNIYPMHMPGHKRNIDIMNIDNIYKMDITEIEGFDNLHDTNGIIKLAEERAAKLYNSKYTKFLVNGSTCGIISAISACTNIGDSIIVARNCHKSVYNTIYIRNLNPIYIYPQYEQDFEINGGILVNKIEQLLITYKNIKAILITSPTYEGIVSDIKSIANIAHKYNIPLIVDEAHGAHFTFCDYFPSTAIENGADIVINSVHKTLPALTQTALIHINSNLIDIEKLKMYLTIYQSSSPSYILIGSIDKCMDLLEKQGNILFENYIKRLDLFYKKSEIFENIRIFNKSFINKNGIFDFDISKLVISTKNTNISGIELYNKLLYEYKIQLELAASNYVIAMTSICDTDEGFERLYNALYNIDKKIKRINEDKKIFKFIYPKVCLTINKTYNSPKKTILLENSYGCISYEFVYLYPPDIPIIVAGEIITKDIIDMLIYYKSIGLQIKGLKDKDLKYIDVVDI